MKEKGYRFLVSRHDIETLEKWQSHLITLGYPPTKRETVKFLNSIKSQTNYKIVKKFTSTRWKRDFLTTKQLEQWYEFYFRAKEGFSTDFTIGFIVKDKFNSFKWQQESKKPLQMNEGL